MSYIMSGEVTAAKLQVPRLDASFPYTYDSVFTSEDGSMQYQLSTTIRKQTEQAIDVIDSPEWLAVPATTWQFLRHHPVQVYIHFWLHSTHTFNSYSVYGIDVMLSRNDI